MPLNVIDHHFNSFEAKVLPVAVKQHIGLLGTKPMGEAVHPSEQDCQRHQVPSLCHEPSHEPGHHGCYSVQILRQALEAVRSFRGLNKVEVSTILAKMPTRREWRIRPVQDKSPL
jgi:hypothetical protein